MPRQNQTIQITTQGRDFGKIYVITEMPAEQAEYWAMRALEAAAKNASVPQGLAEAGMAGIFAVGVRSIMGAPFLLLRPLLEEMFDSCLSIQPDPKKPEILRGAGTQDITAIGKMISDDIEEVATRLQLRDKIIELHTGFSVAAAVSKIWGEGQAALKEISLTTQTSAMPLAPSSQPDSQL